MHYNYFYNDKKNNTSVAIVQRYKSGSCCLCPFVDYLFDGAITVCPSGKVLGQSFPFCRQVTDCVQTLEVADSLQVTFSVYAKDIHQIE